ncbi:MAG: hypothetical protein ACRCYU_15195 [Nocardioides sp.]
MSVAMVIYAAAIPTFVYPGAELSSLRSGLARLVAAVLAIMFGVAYVVADSRRIDRIIHRIRRNETEGESRFSEIIAVEQLKQNVSEAIEKGIFNSQDATAYLMRLMEPAESRARVVEDIRLLDAVFERNGVINFRRINTEGLDRVAVDYLPTLRFRKGYLVDRIKICDGSGSELPVMPYRDGITLDAYCLQLLLVALFGVENLKSRLKDFLSVESLLFSYLVTFDSSRTARQIYEQIRSEVGNYCPDANPKALESLTRFVVHCATNYSVTVLSPRESGVLSKDYGIVTYAYREAQHETSDQYELVPSEPWVDGTEQSTQQRTRRRQAISAIDSLKDRLRSTLGLQAAFLVVDAARSKRCGSYHLRVEAPPGCYVGDVAFIDYATHSAVPKGGAKGVYPAGRAYFNCPPPRRLSSVHLYTRDFVRSSSKSPKLVIKFSELYPGAYLRATILSVATAVSLWLLAITHGVSRASGQGSFFNLFLDNTSEVPDADFGALVVTIPVALWSLVGLSSRPENRLSALAPHLSTFASLTLSLAGLLLFLSPATTWQFLDLWTPKSEFFGVLDGRWIVLILLSVGNSMLALRCWLVRGLREYRESRGEFSQ